MKSAIRFLFLFQFIFFAAACKKDKAEETENTPAQTQGAISFKINYKIDTAQLVFDTIKYVNQAGNQYSIENLFYYLSNFTVKASNGSSFETHAVKYINARIPNYNLFTLDGIPNGIYTSISFNIGIDSAHNIPNGLPNTNENLSMEWPTPMGGGYHFLRLEGYYRDSCCTPGYAMHLGTNISLVKITLPISITIDSNIQSITLTMNINEWFKNPLPYDFNVDGNFSMGNNPAMLKLATNGVDVFN